MQVYIVSGGFNNGNALATGNGQLASTETLEKDGGSEWQEVASLPSATFGFRGLGLDRGRFIVTGKCWTVFLDAKHFFNSLLPRIDFSNLECQNTYFWVSWG